MPKNILTLRDLGHGGIMAILDILQARKAAAESGISAEILASGSGRSANLGAMPSVARGAAMLFARESASERLALCSCLDDLGISREYFAPGSWKREPSGLADEAPAYGFYRDLCLVYGLKKDALHVLAEYSGTLTINMGNESNRPPRLLADLAFFHTILSAHKDGQSPLQDTIQPIDWTSLRLAWVGGANGLANSLIEAAMYFPFELFMALPEWGEPDREILGLSLAAGARIFLTREPDLAVEGASFVYEGVEKNPDFSGAGKTAPAMAVTNDLMTLARPDAVLLPGLENDELARLPKDLIDIYRKTRPALLAHALTAED